MRIWIDEAVHIPDDSLIYDFYGGPIFKRPGTKYKGEVIDVKFEEVREKLLLEDKRKEVKK